MRLDLVIPTHNRAALLERTLASVLNAEAADGLEVRIVVVDNASRDRTAEVVREHQPRFGGRLAYLYEGRPGKSHALNAAIRASDADLVGMIDDDEELDRGWFLEVARAFAEGGEGLDFIGGPYVPRWGAEPPRWLPPDYQAVVGWVDGGREVRDFDASFGGTLMGGNAVVRRRTLERVGLYRPELGPAGDRRLLSCEDEEMHERLLAAGARGQYRPGLVIRHYVPPERLTRAYHRRWVFWHGVSAGVMDRLRPPQRIAYVAGVPRYMIGDLARGVARVLRGGGRRWFSEELRLRDFAGFLYGKFLYRPPAALADALAGPAARTG